MDHLPENKLLNFNNDTLQVVRKIFGFDSTSDINKAIDVLEQWVKKQNHFVKTDFDRNYLERVIIRCKGSVERAKERMDKLCTLKTLIPHFFGDFEIERDFPEYKTILTHAIIPNMTRDHERVYIFRNIGKKFDSNLMIHYMQLTLMSVEYLCRYDYNSSYIAILDYRDANLTELSMKMNPLDLRQGMTFVTEGYGTRVKAIHILSPSKLIELIVVLLKQVLSSKLGERIQVHKTLDSLYENMEREILPIDYGGSEVSLKELQDNWIQELSLEENKEYLRMMNNARTDESKRQTAKFNEQYMGMPGSFRTLSVD